MTKRTKKIETEIQVGDLVEVVTNAGGGSQTGIGFVGLLDNVWTDNGVTKFTVVDCNREEEFAYALEIKRPTY